jgi:hypothetical protein
LAAAAATWLRRFSRLRTGMLVGAGLVVGIEAGCMSWSLDTSGTSSTGERFGLTEPSSLYAVLILAFAKMH